MTRVRASDYDIKKKAIIDKAAALIARKGFDGATMMDVAKACGTSKSHIYHYFPSKEDLLFAIVHDHITRQAADLERIVAQPLPAEERFQGFVESFIRVAARERDEHIMLMNDLKFLPRAKLQEIRRMEVRLTDMLVELLREINPGLMAAERVRKPYALLLFGMMIWTLSWFHRSGPIAPKELAGRIAHLFVHGFKAPPPELDAVADTASARSSSSRATTLSARVSSAPSKMERTRASTK